MFWPDITKLKRFYETPLGQLARRRIRTTIRTLWDYNENSTVLTIDYGIPYMPTPNKDQRIFALMPAAMGVMRWPDAMPNHAILADEDELPFADNSIDYIVIAHALEYSDQAHHMLQEAWRILPPGGKLLIVAPHRLSLWSQRAISPFAYGHPFTAHQLRKLLKKTNFVPTQIDYALCFPPAHSRFMLRTIPLWEKLSAISTKKTGGVIIIEAEKQLYAFTREASKRSRIRSPFYMPIAGPVTPYSQKD